MKDLTAIRAKPIKALKLSNGAFNALMRAHIRTIGELYDYKMRDYFRKIQGVGKVYSKEIEDKLEAYMNKE